MNTDEHGTTDPQISQIKIQFWNLRNLRNLRMGSVPPCGMVRVYVAAATSSVVNFHE